MGWRCGVGLIGVGGDEWRLRAYALSTVRNDGDGKGVDLKTHDGVWVSCTPM
jgi:hypothetical protein